MFQLPRYVINGGKIAVDDGEIRDTSIGTLKHVVPEYDEETTPMIEKWFEKNYTVSFRNYQIGDDEFV